MGSGAKPQPAPYGPARWWRLLLPGVAALLAAAGVPVTPDREQLPGLSAADPRVGVDVGAAPWSALLKLQVPGATRCSAVLLQPDLAATAAHCLFVRRAGHFAPPGSVHVLSGYRDGNWSGHAVALSYRVGEGFDPLRTEATRGADVAVLRLRGPLPGPGVGLGEAAPGQAAALGGFSQDRAEAATADLHCRVLGPARDPGGRVLLVHDCAATQGASGGALLVRGPDGTPALAGLENGGFVGRAGGTAVPAASLGALLAPP